MRVSSIPWRMMRRSTAPSCAPERHADADFAGAAGDGVAHDSVEADGGEDQADEAEDAEERAGEARQEERVADVLFHGLGIEDGHGWVERVDLLRTADAVSRVRRGADEERVAHESWVGGDGLLERAIEDWPQVFAEGAGFDVSDYADDLVGGAAAVMRWPMGFSSRKSRWTKAWLTMATLGPVGAFVAEVAAGEAGNAHGFEVAGSGHVELDVGRVRRAWIAFA